MTAPRFIIVSGLPASGKSTVASAVAGALDLPLLDKDAFLEALFDSQGTGDAAWRRALSHAADEALRREAETSGGAVLVSWWRHPLSPVATGTPTHWLAHLPGSIIEVHCRCSPATAAQRFLARQRHAGHLDGRWQHDELIASFDLHAALGALAVGQLVGIDTEAALSAGPLSRCVAAVRAAAVISAYSAN